MWPKPITGFAPSPEYNAPTYQGVSIFDYDLPRSGFAYSQELHKVFVAHWANRTLESFEELDGDRQSVLVSAYNCKMQMSGIEAMETAKRARRNARSKKKA